MSFPDFHHYHHHHHHVQEGLGVFPVPWSSRWSWSFHPSWRVQAPSSRDNKNSVTLRFITSVQTLPLLRVAHVRTPKPRLLENKRQMYLCGRSLLRRDKSPAASLYGDVSFQVRDTTRQVLWFHLYSARTSCSHLRASLGRFCINLMKDVHWVHLVLTSSAKAG
jgi:hypothetical protein